MRPRALQLTDSQRLARRMCLRDLVRLFPEPRQRNAARLAGVAESTLAGWLKDRDIPTDDVLMLATAIREVMPHHEAEVVALVARHLVEVDGGRWVPEDADPVGPYADESADVTVAHGELTVAMRSGDHARIVAAARRLVEEAEEAARAAVQGAQA